MGDLISRVVYKSKLLKELGVLNKEYRKAILNEDNDLILAIQNQQSAYMIALRLLDNEPTAYDVRKVVEELEKTIEIIKQSDVSDDVCEWRLCDEESNVYDTTCRNLHILNEGTPRENNYSYCPYCGKKIEVVE